MQRLAILLMLSVCVLPGWAQYSFDFTHKKVNYNYENKLRFEWTMIQERWDIFTSARSSFRLIGETQAFATWIAKSIDEIALEAQEGRAMDIYFYPYGSLFKLDVFKDTRPVSFVFDGDKAVFTGLHKINIKSERIAGISIFFDDPQDLALIGSIDFASLEAEIYSDLFVRKVLPRKERNRAHEYVFYQSADEMYHVGSIKLKSKRVVSFNPAVGMDVSIGRLGIGLSHQLSLSNFVINQMGESRERFRISLVGSLSIMEDISHVRIGLQALTPDIFPFINNYSASGLEMGLTLRDNFNNDVIPGLYISFVHVYKRFRFNFDIQNHYRNPETVDDWLNITLRAAYLISGR